MQFITYITSTFQILDVYTNIKLYSLLTLVRLRVLVPSLPRNPFPHSTVMYFQGGRKKEP